MKISVITPCLNAEAFIERAIKSVLDQNYTDFEHIIIDGGSTDRTLSIVSKYSHLRLISGPDAGQADAMNKGIEIATGDIISFVNADDYYLPGAFLNVVQAFDNQTDFVVGNVLVKSKRLGAEFLNTPRYDLKGMLRHWEPNAFPHNPVGYFYRLSVQKDCPFNAKNYESMDLEFLLEAASKYQFKKIEHTLGCFEDGYGTKTDKTQLKADYWRPSTFPYIEQYLDRLSAAERHEYEMARREGYAVEQANSNQRARDRGRAPALQRGSSSSVSVVIPTHNDSDTLPRAINSVLTQPFGSFEIIVVDDASDHDVSSYLFKRFGADSRITVHRRSDNGMTGGARNSGIDRANGEYIYFLDADDRLMPNALERLVAVAADTNVDVVQGGSLIGAPDSDPRTYHAADFASDGGLDGLERFAAHEYASIAWNKLYRRKFLGGREGIRFAEKMMHEDVGFAAQTAFLANGIVSISDPIVQYTTNFSSLTRKQPSRLNIESYLATYLSLINILSDFGVGYRRHQELFLRILASHGGSDFGPKLVESYARMGAPLFRNEILSVAGENAGDCGLAVGDLLIYFVSELHSRRKTRMSSRLKSLVQNFIKGTIKRRNFLKSHRAE